MADKVDNHPSVAAVYPLEYWSNISSGKGTFVIICIPLLKSPSWDHFIKRNVFQDHKQPYGHEMLS